MNEAQRGSPGVVIPRILIGKVIRHCDTRRHFLRRDRGYRGKPLHARKVYRVSDRRRTQRRRPLPSFLIADILA